MVLAASGVQYLASGPNPERALPLLPESEGKADGLPGPWTTYPQLYWWESPDGSRVLHWRSYHYGDGLRFGFDVGPARHHDVSSVRLVEPCETGEQRRLPAPGRPDHCDDFARAHCDRHPAERERLVVARVIEAIQLAGLGDGSAA